LCRTPQTTHMERSDAGGTMSTQGGRPMSVINEPSQAWQPPAEPPPGPPGHRPVHRRSFTVLAVSMVAALIGGLSLSWAIRPLQRVPTVGTSGVNLSMTALEAKVDPALVDVVSTLGYEQAQAAGTGIVLTSSGEVLTNNHVIDGATS